MYSDLLELELYRSTWLPGVKLTSFNVRYLIGMQKLCAEAVLRSKNEEHLIRINNPND